MEKSVLSGFPLAHLLIKRKFISNNNSRFVLDNIENRAVSAGGRVDVEVEVKSKSSLLYCSTTFAFAEGLRKTWPDVTSFRYSSFLRSNNKFTFQGSRTEYTYIYQIPCLFTNRRKWFVTKNYWKLITKSFNSMFTHSAPMCSYAPASFSRLFIYLLFVILSPPSSISNA